MALDLYVILIAGLCILSVIGLLYLFLVMTNTTTTGTTRFEEEKYFMDPSLVPPVKHRFPTLFDQPSVQLSIIVPAYNEEQRMPSMLDECIAFMEARLEQDRKYSYEIIVVDDGSVDNTTKVALSYAKKIGVEKFRVLSSKKNRGKGGAVRLGMMSARGKFLLFVDADGATKFCDISKLEDVMEVLYKKNKNSVVVGSRAHLEKQAVATRSAFRTFLMYGFHSLVWLFGVRSIRDTQCGFKLFSREAAALLFSSLHVEKWAFDVELLYIASQLKMLIREVAVTWTEIDGSKLVPFWSWIQMGKDLILIWLKYQTGLWKIHNVEKVR